jgi:nucleotidyltransferase substrate binding protein (TIGR01987 family)
MDRLTLRIETARRALGTLEELAGEHATKVIRDASIQRFEYSFEALWKAAQAVLLHRFGQQSGSPKPAIRACLDNGLLTEDEARLALAMVDHRNLTSHTYNESLADEIFAALPGYRQLMWNWLERMSKT